MTNTPDFGTLTGQPPYAAGFLFDNTFTRSATNTFSFVQSVNLGVIYVLAADRVFHPPEGAESATHNYFFETAADVFSFTSSTGFDPTFFITQYLGFTPRTFVDCNNWLGLGVGNAARISVVDSASNSFSWLTHDTLLAYPRALQRAYSAIDTLVLTETAIAFNSQLAEDFFALADTADPSPSEYDRAPTHSVIKQHLSYSIQGQTCQEKEYTPYTGSSGDASYPAVPSTPPTLGTGTLTLTYPRITPTLTLALKNPKFGNADTLRYTTIERRTRGGDDIVFSDPKWASSQLLELDLVNVAACNTTIDEVVTFLNTSLGKEIGLADWEGRNWKGIILAPDVEITNDATGYRVKILFQGELL